MLPEMINYDIFKTLIESNYRFSIRSKLGVPIYDK